MNTYFVGVGDVVMLAKKDVALAVILLDGVVVASIVLLLNAAAVESVVVVIFRVEDVVLPASSVSKSHIS